MKISTFILLVVLCNSCIPLRIAPNIETDKVMVAKKFKRKLPKQHAFIFEDPKDANEFYNYINTKYELGHQDVEFNVPFEVNQETYYFSFYEVEIPNKTINLVPLAIDAALEDSSIGPMFENNYLTRTGNWYLVITVNDDSLNDALADKYPDKKDIVTYLKKMRKEYLDTHNYLEVLLSKEN